MSCICVTGGAGYIGSHAVKILLEKGFDVVVIDNLATGYKEAVDKRAIFYKEDIHHTTTIKEILKKHNVDAVIHFAAFSLVGESMEDPLKYYKNNVEGTRSLLEAMNDAAVKKIVFSSTAAVYGDQDTMPITETMNEQPTNTYGQTKLAIEQMMKWADKAHNIQYVSLRYFNVAGAYHTGEIGENHNPETHLIPLILQVPLNKRDQIYIFGDDYDTFDHTAIRDYIHIEDLIDAHIKALHYIIKGNKSDIFNLGSGSGFSVLEIIKTSRKITNHKIKAIKTTRRAGDPPVLIASYQKAHRILHWKPTHDINDIITSAWNFHKNHPNGYTS